jgi:hypothetical protein
MERLYTMKNTIDDTPRVVARHFVKTMRPMSRTKSTENKLAEIGSQIVKQARAKTKTVKSVKVGSKKSEARQLFVTGFTAAEVSEKMGITYANAHYYLRAFRKDGGNISQEIK